MFCEAAGTKVGTFIIPDANYKSNGNCGATALTGITHNDKNSKSLLTFTWKAPSTAVAGVTCRAIALDDLTGTGTTATGNWQLNMTTAVFNVIAGSGTTPTVAPTKAPTASNTTIPNSGTVAGASAALALLFLSL
jgi:hypothetical protein